MKKFVLDFIQGGVVLGVTLAFQDDALKCAIPIFMWLLVVVGIYFIRLVIHVLVILLAVCS